MRTRWCGVCGAEFPLNRNQKHCSERCRRTVARAGERQRYAEERGPCTCEHCGATFLGHPAAAFSGRHGNKNAYCTRTCYWEARRQQKIEKYQISEKGRICASCELWRGRDELFRKNREDLRLVFGFENECKQCYANRRLARLGRPTLLDPVACMFCERPFIRRSGKQKLCSVECRRQQQKRTARRNRLARQYGVSPEWFDATLARQGGRCAICRTGEAAFTGDSLAVDHRHSDGAVRGLLCGACNTALGMLNDDPQIVFAAALYLERFNETRDLVAA